MVDQSRPQPYSSNWEQDLGNLVDSTYDTTSINVIPTQEVSTGVTKTATFANADNFDRYMFYIDSTSVTTVAAGMTGLEVSFFLRATSGTPWAQIAVQSGIAAEGFSALKIEGTGGATSGVVPIRDLKIEVTNISSSATATMDGWLVMKAT